MTDLAPDVVAALAVSIEPLGEFEGDNVVSTGIEIPGAAGGLREVLAIEPQVFHKNDRVLVLLETTCGKIRHDPVKDSEDWNRVHVLQVSSATIVDGSVFDDALANQAERIALAKEAAEGTQRLPWADEAQAIHEQGGHAGGLVSGCAACEFELAEGRVEAEDAAKVARIGEFGRIADEDPE